MRRLLALLLLLIPIAAVQAQGLDIGLVSGNEGSLPIVVVPMPYQGAGPAPDTDVASVIRNDLNRSGQCRSDPTAGFKNQPTRGSDIDCHEWRARRPASGLRRCRRAPGGTGAARPVSIKRPSIIEG